MSRTTTWFSPSCSGCTSRRVFQRAAGSSASEQGWRVRDRLELRPSALACSLSAQRPWLRLPFSTPTIPRGLHLRIGSTCETTWSMCMGNERTTSMISGLTWTERPDDADTRKSDTEPYTLPRCPLQADSQLLRSGGLLPLLARAPDWVTPKPCQCTRSRVTPVQLKLGSLRLQLSNFPTNACARIRRDPRRIVHVFDSVSERTRLI
jgi:hypothetical protein